MAAPTNLVAATIDDDSISLSWDAYSGATGYDIERDSVVIVTNHPTTSYTDMGLDPGTSYDYRVRAKLGAGGGGGLTEYVIVHDTFTDTPGTLITAHTPDVDVSGLGWGVVYGGLTSVIDSTGTKLDQSNSFVYLNRDGVISLRATFINWELNYGSGSYENPQAILFDSNPWGGGLHVIFGNGTVLIKQGNQQYGTNLAGSPFTTPSLTHGLQNVKIESDGETFVAIYRAPAGTSTWEPVCVCTDPTIASLSAAGDGRFSIGAFNNAGIHDIGEFKLEQVNVVSPLFTGGIISQPGDGYVYHTFTTSGTLTPIGDPVEVEYLVVAGGGGGGNNRAGGGGAGGMRTGTATIPAARTATIGGGGAANVSSGTNTSLGIIASIGGGLGGTAPTSGLGGGSGGGGAGRFSGSVGSGGAGTAGQGMDGASGVGSADIGSVGGGGGGASEAGSVGVDLTNGGDGGDGAEWPSNSGVFYAGGGGGGADQNGAARSGGAGGAGGGGTGMGSAIGTIGAANKGGGGGGGDGAANQYGGAGFAGGSGIVVVRYPVDYAWAGVTDGFVYLDSSGTSTTSGSTYTSEVMDFGPAAANRVIVAACGHRVSGGDSLTSVTIGGVAATIDASTNWSTAIIARAAVPTGTTGQVEVTLSSLEGSHLRVVLYVCYGTVTLDDADAVRSVDPLTVTLNNSAGAHIIAATHSSPGVGSTTYTWSSPLVQDVGWAAVENSASMASAANVPAGPTVITASPVSTYPGLAAAAYIVS